MLAADVHLGSQNCTRGMEGYVHGRKADGTHIIDVAKTYEKLNFACRILAAVRDPRDICVVAARPFAHRAVHKFCANTGSTAMVGPFVPGSFTNRQCTKFVEPAVVIVNDPRTDAQAIREASCANIPVIALCSTDAALRFVDVVIPCNNKGKRAIGLVYWFLARQFLRMTGRISLSEKWDVMPDMFFHQEASDIAAIEKMIQGAQDVEIGEAVEAEGWDDIDNAGGSQDDDSEW